VAPEPQVDMTGVLGTIMPLIMTMFNLFIMIWIIKTMFGLFRELRP
jgi:hypothetical protein